MRTNAVILGILGLFFLLADITYWIWQFAAGHPIDWVGSLAILMTVPLAWFPAYFFWKADKNTGGVLPEDSDDADIDDGDGNLGFYSPWSWWPITLAASIAVITLGFVIGLWLIAIGFVLTLVALVGWSFEYNRGHFGA